MKRLLLSLLVMLLIVSMANAFTVTESAVANDSYRLLLPMSRSTPENNTPVLKQFDALLLPDEVRFGQTIQRINRDTMSVMDGMMLGKIAVAKYEWLMHDVPAATITIDDYQNRAVYDQTLIDREYYYSQLPQGYNNGSSCAHVATTLLLGYYDLFCNDSIIPNTIIYGDVIYNNILEGKEDSPYYDDRRFSSYGISKDFHDYLLQYGYGELNYPIDEGLTWIELRNLIDSYLDTCPIGYGNNISVETTDSVGSAKERLDNGQPLIMCMSGYSYAVNNSFYMHSNTGHAVVVYGYQETNLGTYYKVHMGWYGQVYNEIWVKPDTVSCFLFVNYTGSNIGSGYHLYHGNQTHAVGLTYDVDNYYEYVSSDALNDNFVCVICGYAISFAHSYRDIESYNGNQHTRRCSFCESTSQDDHELLITGHNSSTHHVDCIECNYSASISHTLPSGGYTSISSTTHSCECSVCHYDIESNHTLVHTPDSGNSTHTSSCTKCGYSCSGVAHVYGYVCAGASGHYYGCTACEYMYGFLSAHQFVAYGLGWKRCTVCDFMARLGLDEPIVNAKQPSNPLLEELLMVQCIEGE